MSNAASFNDALRDWQVTYIATEGAFYQAHLFGPPKDIIMLGKLSYVLSVPLFQDFFKFIYKFLSHTTSS